MLIIPIERNSPVPLFRQIYKSIATLINTKALLPGDRLPSSRKLAQHLELDRTTVYRAYEELWANGYINSKPGSYSVVNQVFPQPMDSEAQLKTEINWADKIEAALESVSEKQAVPENCIDFKSLSPDPKIIPAASFRKALNHVMYNSGSYLLQYQTNTGYPPLLKYISRRLKQHKIRVCKNELITTQGVQHALDLLCRLLIKPGTKIITENPTYPEALNLFRYHKAEVVPVKTTKMGMDLSHLEKLLKKEHPAFIYTMPNYHNPLGICTTMEHREKLINLCAMYKVPIIEDGFEEEMKYFGKAIPPLKALDTPGIVIYLGTFSKIAFPGLRLGWIAAPSELISSLIKLKKLTLLSDNYVLQAAVHQFCKSGQYNLHLNRIHRLYRRRMALTLKTIKQIVDGQKIQAIWPIGGYTIWVDYTKCSITEMEFNKQLSRYKVLISPGKGFFVERPREKTFRISIAHASEEDIINGIAILGRLLK